MPTLANGLHKVASAGTMAGSIRQSHGTHARALPAKAQNGSIPIEALVGKLNSPRSTKEIGEVQGECALLDILFQHTLHNTAKTNDYSSTSFQTPGVLLLALLLSATPGNGSASARAAAGPV